MKKVIFFLRKKKYMFVVYLLEILNNYKGRLNNFGTADNLLKQCTIFFYSTMRINVTDSKTKFLLNLSPSEGSPKVVLEALLNGCVVIALSNSFKKFAGFEEQIIFCNSIAEITHFIETGAYMNECNFGNEYNLNHNDRKILTDRYTI